MGKTKALEINGSSNIGLFAYATDEYCLIGKGLPEETIKTFKIALDVPIYEITIGESQQIGAYVNGNSKCLLVPNIITEKEKKSLDKLGIKYAIIETINTALGNDLIIGENYFFYIPEFEKKAVEMIQNTLWIKGETIILDDWEVIGSIVVTNLKGGLIQKEVHQKIRKLIENKLELKLEAGTINFGSHIIGGGIVVNSKGMVVGKASAGIEITNADMAFGFLER